MLGWLMRKLKKPDPAELSSEELMATCERFWGHPHGDYGEFVWADTELANRGPEIRDWCRRLLTNPDYRARETGAFLLGQLGARGQLGDAVEAVVAELGALTARPVEEDSKETQAIVAAVNALARIGHPAAISHIRAVLMSDDEDIVGDTQWDAADALGRLVGQSFMQPPDPVGAARNWLSSQT
jgi:PBS lyase HEAT-like repeat